MDDKYSSICSRYSGMGDKYSSFGGKYYSIRNKNSSIFDRYFSMEDKYSSIHDKNSSIRFFERNNHLLSLRFQHGVAQQHPKKESSPSKTIRQRTEHKRKGGSSGISSRATKPRE